jgi:hypothetical protein
MAYVPAIMRGVFYNGTMNDVPFTTRGKPSHKRREKQSETDCFEHKKREPLIGSLVANTIKYTRFLPKNQAFHAPWQGFFKVPYYPKKQ